MPDQSLCNELCEISSQIIVNKAGQFGLGAVGGDGDSCAIMEQSGAVGAVGR